MFVRFWILWMIAGLALAVWVFAWAIRTRQFSQGRRAALLPFDDRVGARDRPPSGRPMSWGVWAAMAVAVGGILLTLLMLVLAFRPSRPDRSGEKAGFKTHLERGDPHVF